MASGRKRDRNAEARAAGYASDYERRKAKSREQGYRTPYDRTQGRKYAAGKPVAPRSVRTARDNANAQREGFLSAYQRALFRRTHPGASVAEQKAWQKARILAHYKITEAEFQRRLRASRRWLGDQLASRKNEDARNALARASAYSMFDTRIANKPRGDSDWLMEWSPQRVGYVLAYYAAVVDPKTNYQQGLGGRKGKKRPVTRDGYRKMNAEQYYYLTKYTNLMTVNEYEATYGTQQTRQAAGTNESALYS
jgi:hypothetical protein